MTILFIAALHALPILFVGFLTNNKVMLNITAVVMVGIAIATGSINYLLSDLVAIGLAYAFTASVTETA